MAIKIYKDTSVVTVYDTITQQSYNLAQDEDIVASVNSSDSNTVDVRTGGSIASVADTQLFFKMPYQQFQDESGTALGASASATVTAINAIFDAHVSRGTFRGILLGESDSQSIGVGSGTIKFQVGDTFVNFGNVKGYYIVDTAFDFTKQANVTQALLHYNTHGSKVTKIAVSGDSKLVDLDPTTSSDSFSESMNAFALTTAQSTTITPGTAGLIIAGNTTTTGNLTSTGTPTLGGIQYPTSDGTSGQLLKTNGSAVLSFVDPPTPLSGADQTLSGNRIVDVDGNYLQVKNGSNVRLQYNPNTDQFEFQNGLKVSGEITGSLSGVSSGQVKFQEPGMGGTNGVIIKGPSTNLTSDVTFVLPDADGSDGQVIKTDGSGNLSFVDQSSGGGGGGPAILGNISGRYMWSSSDDGERVHTGNFSYGPFNWYSFTSEPSNSSFRSYTASDTVGSTTFSLAASHLLAYGFMVPTTDKKVKIHYAFRLQNAPASSTWGLSLWGADRQASGSTSSSTATLRAETSDITQSSNSSSRVFHGTMETTADFAEDVAVLMAENRSGSLTSTTYMYAQFQIELVD